ncbi:MULTISPECIES: UdgX family uracil-DNA binding protein [unclassified Chelatococcus]|uniref:UdgX family uracil-DNA binding protein n=1 Tax=unclassified Chelatococcus TaxID=2638111 RepID=UPI000300F99A|nr:MULTISPECIES: UdgX family uracil-DNA binding protein [unclassified Chelatococcus]ALA19899.1 DNA polymerase [Chelatococcus sp. CO-6]
MDRTTGDEPLQELAVAEAGCTRCPLYRFATHVVPGEGPSRARLMFVGEQPGDSEDKAGRPFVGPAGRMFERALADAGVPRGKVFVTNAVKHFKFQQRGKRRMHQRPNAHEIDRCKWWLDQEIAIVAPRVIVALGATAVRSILERPATIASLRGEPHALNDGISLFVTIHPSYLLRIRGEADRAGAYEGFVEDVRRSWRHVAAG